MPRFEAKTELAKNPNKLDSRTKDEKTRAVGSSGKRTSVKGEPLFATSIRRTIDGKPYDCGTNASSEAERATAKQLCESLRAAS